MNELLYGAAYYDEYMPYDRLQDDVKMLQKAGMNVVRIAESTWSTLEPKDGIFDFRSIDRVLDAMSHGGIHVIIGTPTYAVPSWLVKKDPEVLADTKNGRRLYGPRQIMDITNATYLFHAERVIRELLSHVASHPAVIGYQIDNETKYYGTAGEKVQERFVSWLQEKFQGDIEAVNQAYGLNYWSNAVHDWDDFPDVRNTINGSLAGAFEEFQRGLVMEFLTWQSDLVKEYRREDQFITHNFDYGWKGYSYGIQPDVNHFEVQKALDVAGTDIYHPSQDELTGLQISFGGALSYSLKKKNYYVLETEAQGFSNWTPFDGQLRLQAFSHLGSGADMVEYWHWSSIHNACETYWKGVLSHDFSEGKVYKEACTVGADMKRLSPKLLHMKKENKIALLVSNRSLSALRFFKNSGGYVDYNDTVMAVFEALYELNYECDILSADGELPDFSKYEAVFVPALYSASEAVLQALSDYTEAGGRLIGTFKTGFTDENVKVYHDTQPHILHQAFGIHYDQFALLNHITLQGNGLSSTSVVANEKADGFFECLQTDTAEKLLGYDHYNWRQYPALVKNSFGKGKSLYLGCMLPKETLKKVFRQFLEDAGIQKNIEENFPVIGKKGISQEGKDLLFLYNYGRMPKKVQLPEGNYTELVSEKALEGNTSILLKCWDFMILEKE